jgi:hypothetical protein
MELMRVLGIVLNRDVPGAFFIWLNSAEGSLLISGGDPMRT